MTEIPKSPPNRSRLLIGAVVATVIALDAGLWLSIARLSENRRHSEVERLSVQAQAAALSLDNQTKELLLRVDQGLRVVVVEVEERGWEVDLDHLKRRALIPGNEVARSGLVDAAGVLRSGPDSNSGISVADRDYFLFHKTLATDGLHVGLPMVGGASGLQSIPVSRRIDGPGGAFRGIAVAAIEPGTLVDISLFAYLPSNTETAIFGLDGIMRARRVDRRASAGETMVDTPVFGLLEKTDAGTFVGRSSHDGVERVHGFRRIDGLPLGVVVGIPRAAAIERAQGYENELSLAGAAATAFLLLIGGLIVVLALRQQAATAAAARATLRADELQLASEIERRKAEDARRMAEDARRQAQSALLDVERARQRALDARGAAEEANRTKIEFLASMSHELRTPLNSVIGFAQLLATDAKEKLSENQAISVAVIERNGLVLQRLIEDVLDFAKIEGGDFEFQPTHLDLADLLGELDATLRPFATARDIALTVELPQSHALAAFADRMRCMQILTNLGANAVKYSRPGGRVAIAAEKRGDRVRIVVKDAGVGIPRALQAELFKPFRRLGHETGTTEGSGIGLAISRRLALKMGGDIEFASEESVGSRFWLELPAAGAREAEFPPSSDTAHGRGVPNAGKSSVTTVLYVEDNQANLTLMERLIAREPDLKLLTAVNATMGLELARLHRPKVIVMDLHMPVIDGFEALRLLKAMPETAAIPVIALTASVLPREVERGLSAGFVAYLTKPIDIALFLGKLREVVDGALN